MESLREMRERAKRAYAEKHANEEVEVIQTTGNEGTTVEKPKGESRRNKRSRTYIWDGSEWVEDDEE